VACFDFLGGNKVKDDCGDDACRNGNDCASEPIRKDAKGQYREARP
jgi:hypothetical protein